jgi:polysaccharide pyruvyl transferase WcaK-like protein
MRVLLINDTSAHRNWGAQATPVALLALITRHFSDPVITRLPHSWLTRSFRRVRVPFGWGPVFIDDRADSVFSCLMRRYSREEAYFPAVWDDFNHFADEWMAGRGGPPGVQFIALARAADLVLYNAENSIYRNTEEGCHGLFLLWLAKTRLGKPGCVINHTAHLTDVKPVMRTMVQMVYPVLDLVGVREICSLRNLEALGIPNAQLFADVVFSLPVPDSTQQTTGFATAATPFFCLSASGLPASAPRGEWEGEVSRLVHALKTVVPHAVLVAKDTHCQFLEAVAHRTGSLYFGPEHDFAELWPLFQKAVFQITGHFHNTIFGAMVGCPFVPLSVNNHKMKGLCEDLEWQIREPYDITALNLCRDKILEEAQAIVADRTALSAHLIERSNVLRQRVEELGTKLAQVAHQGAEAGPAVRGVA